MERAVVGLTLASLLTSRACYIQGTDSGTCDSDLKTDADYRSANMPFCGSVVNYKACVPEARSVDSDRHFPDGRWYNHTILTKDKWVEKTVKQMIKFRMGLEQNRSLLNKGINEYGEPNEIEVRFYENTDCRRAYRNCEREPAPPPQELRGYLSHSAPTHAASAVCHMRPCPRLLLDQFSALRRRGQLTAYVPFRV